MRTAERQPPAASTRSAPDLPPGRRQRQHSPTDGLRWWSIASTVVALVPIAVAGLRAAFGDRVPVGDNAYFAIRARDVLSWDPPLLGTWTSASLNSETQFNNPGPLLFDLLALPTTLVPGGGGLALGVALLNGAAVTGVAVFAHRRGGPLLATLAMAVTAVLCWTMGSEVLIDAPQPASLLLPFLFFVVLVWSVTCGDRTALPWAAGVGSLLLQSYVTYVYMVVALAVLALGSVAGQLWITRRDDAAGWPSLRRRWVGAAGVAAGVFALCWAQPLVEQFTSDSTGNLTRLTRAAGDPALEPIGFDVGTRLVAQVVTMPPWWLRPSYQDYLAESTPDGAAPLPSLGLAVVTLVPLLVALGLLWWDRRRHGDGVGRWGIVTAAVALAGGLITAGRMPKGAFAVPAPHTFRWLWPLAAFIGLALAAGVVLRWQGRRPTSGLVAAFTAATVVFAGLNLPATNQGASEVDTASFAGVRDLATQLDPLEEEGTLLVDLRALDFANPYGIAVLAQMRRQGIPFVFDDPGLVYQLGPERRYNGENADARLLITFGDAALDQAPGVRRVALHEGLSEEEQQELDRLKVMIGAYIRENGLPVETEGREALGQFGPGGNATPLGPGTDPAGLFQSRVLLSLTRDGSLSLDPEWSRRFERYTALQSRWDEHTVAVSVAPIDH